MVITALLNTTVSAQTWNIAATGVNLTASLSNGTLTVTGTGAIPDYTTSTAPPWFGYNDYITAVDIKNGVTRVGDWVFYGCSNLTSVSLPSTLKAIGSYAFGACSVQTIFLPDSVRILAGNAFNSCSRLTNISVNPTNTYFSTENGILYSKDKTVLLTYPRGKQDVTFTIPAYVNSIGESAFSTCNYLTTVNIPNTVTNMGAHAFSYMQGITSVAIPASITNIKNSAFASCSNLASINLSEGLDSIGTYAFDHCIKLTSIVIPEGVSYLGSNSFSYCSGLGSVSIPAGITTLGYSIFSNNTSLTYITFSEGVTAIGENMFENCTSLSKITIPQSVTTLGYQAFSSCTSLETVIVKWQTPLALSRAVGDIFYYWHATLVVPNGTKELYKADNRWKAFSPAIIEESEYETATPHIQFETVPYIADNILYIDSPVAESLSIYATDGRIVKTTSLPDGRTAIEFSRLPAGIYIVKAGTKIAKVIKR